MGKMICNWEWEGRKGKISIWDQFKQKGIAGRVGLI